MAAYKGLNGVPPAGNHWLLTDVLRQRWGFKGWVVSDSEAVTSLETRGLAGDKEQTAVKALNAGLDMEMAFARSAYDLLPVFRPLIS
jgi:beta-glucosidase